MLFRAGKLTVIVALIATTGLHWTLLQTVAWTTMLADHLQAQSFTRAVSETFDGKLLALFAKPSRREKNRNKNILFPSKNRN